LGNTPDIVRKHHGKWSKGRQDNIDRLMIAHFLLGVSIGTILATILQPRENPEPTPPKRDMVDITSEESFPASDSPAY
jgi:hypothetical protein